MRRVHNTFPLLVTHLMCMWSNWVEIALTFTPDYVKNASTENWFLLSSFLHSEAGNSGYRCCSGGHTPQPCAQTCVTSFCRISGCLLTDANRDEERHVCEHLPQYVPEVPFSTAVAVLHQLCAPQNCTEKSSNSRDISIFAACELPFVFSLHFT